MRESKTSLISYYKEYDSRWNKKDSKIKTQVLVFLDASHKMTGEILLSNLNKFGLFPVSVGELASWLPEIKGGNHGNEWLIKKL
ncbi:hypothetical protein ACL43R_04410 [Lactococcus formosensis]|uniref:hypothetical protein n=1 Tax=Lactococcus formosensis TaxID=1281486 RepID=UPI0039F67D86